jgi:hypothetical protein
MGKYVSTIELSARVRVALVIESGKIMPRWFEQMDRASRERVHVKQVCYTWTYNEGSAKIISFAVTDGANTYRLSLNTQDFSWTLGIADM